ncbi:MAG TPA: hypothetical protein PKH79_10355 [Prolixibacteraceae bacterium]|nr:hypothetical protein [Prolixibacteraceae bacterium]
MKRWYFLFTVALLVLAFTGCKKDDEEVAQMAQMKLAENLSKLGIPDAIKNSSNSYAQQVVGYYDQAMSIDDYTSWFDLPDDATHDGNNYYWSYGGFSVWEVYDETSSGYTRDIYFKTTETSKLKYLHSEESKDGKTGTMEIYNYLSETDELLYTYDWVFDSKGNLTLTEKWSDGSLEYDIVSNVDLSGSAKYYSNGKLLYEFYWNTDGSGSYKWYEDDGSVAYSDSWTAAQL